MAMNSIGTFPGVYRINGRDVTDSVTAFLTDYEISLGDAKKTMFARETLCLHPVSAKMFSRIGTSEQMSRGVRYSISGDNIGAFTYGPLGHPGDGEYDHRPVQRFSAFAQFTREKLEITFEGTTEVGRSGVRDRTELLEPWVFEIRLIVPKIELLTFLQIGAEPAKYFMDRLNGCEGDV